MTFRAVLLTVASLSCASAVGAQVTNTPPSQLAGYRAILQTPAGALPQLVPVQRMLKRSYRGAVALRYGRYTIEGFPDALSNIGLSGAFGFSPRIQLGATIGRRTCGSCEGLTMGSLDLNTTLFHKEASNDIGGDTDIGLQLSAGMASADTSDFTARSFVASLPLAVTIPQAENSFLSLFLAPGAGYGLLKEPSGTFGSARMIISAGVQYAFEFGMGAHMSAQRILIKDSPTQLGFALSWAFGGGRSR